MNDFVRRSALCEERLRDGTLPMWQRIHQALIVWKGFSFSGLPSKLRQEIEERFVAINAIFARYQIKSEEDYRQMSLDDLDAIATELRKVGG